MYRVYNNKTKRWVKDNIFIAPNDDLYITKKTIFGKNELFSISDEDYVIHRDIELFDKNGKLIFEGDHLRATISDEKTVVGLVTYAHELSAYIILCFGSGEYFTLGSEVSTEIEIIGNVFDGYDEGKQDVNKSLQESKT